MVKSRARWIASIVRNGEAMSWTPLACSACSPSPRCWCVTRWRIAAIGSSQPLPPPARWARFTDFCRAPGRSDWSRRSGPWWRYGAGASGGNDLAVLLQAESEAAQGAVWMRAAALDQDGVDPRQSCAERVDTDVAAEIVALDHRARQQRHAHVGGDAADHAVERAQFKPRGGRPAKFRQRLFEPL